MGIGGSVVASSVLLASSLALCQAWQQHLQTPLTTNANNIEAAKVCICLSLSLL